MRCSLVKQAGKARRILLASFGEARPASRLCPCDLDQNTRSKDARPPGKSDHFGLWLSLVERLVRGKVYYAREHPATLRKRRHLRALKCTPCAEKMCRKKCRTA